MRIIDQQLGRILLVVAIAIAIAVNVSNPPLTVEPEPSERLNRPVQVKLLKSELATASAEVFFLKEIPAQPSDRFVFAEPKTTFVFQPVDLDVPPANIGRAPQILPEPGPMLEGAVNLPRFGDEFTPVTPASTPATGPGTGATPNSGAARPVPGSTATSGAGTVPPSPVFNPFADPGKK